MKLRLFLVSIFSFLITFSTISAQNYRFNQTNWKKISRGELSYTNDSALMQDCYIVSEKIDLKDFEFSFTATVPASAKEVQIWSGFRFENRESRYALGLRGGNSNDLYLCRYSPEGRSKMLALAPVDFQIKKETKYNIKVVIYGNTIKVFLNNRSLPEISVKDENFIPKGKIVLGGGWTKTRYSNFTYEILTQEKFDKYKNLEPKELFPFDQKKKEKQRIAERKNYKPLVVKSVSDSEREISLDGKWLIKPDYEIKNKEEAISPEVNDEDWHLISVPDFWNPVTNWMHLQKTKMPHPGSGVSDKYWQKELARCADFTFDYKKTKSAWYRQWIDIKELPENKKFTLTFDAVSKMADVWVNGKFVGSHLGMFGDFNFDISNHLIKGKNLITVFVRTKLVEKNEHSDDIATVAITVEVTNDMLNSIPRGMFNDHQGGIWQPVKLVVTEKLFIDNHFARTKTDGGNFDLTIKNEDNQKKNIDVVLEVTDSEGKEFYKEKKNNLTVNTNSDLIVNFELKNLEPKLWSPEFPNLHKVKYSVYENGQLTDQLSDNIGFRTFETRGNKFFLNNNAYWLRGANHPPLGIAPNDIKLAEKFTKNMHDNNQMVTRSHGSPHTKVWLDASDKEGVGVSIEGTWPWMLLGKGMADAKLLQLWKEEMLALVKKYRNHPSVFMWTLGNEMYFTNYYHSEPQEVRIEKWRFLSNVIKEIRKIDPTRPIGATSGYIRYQPDYDSLLVPLGIDDGDFDDSHNSYFGWYNPDHYFLFDGNWTKKLYLSTGANPDRPFITQELSTGYPNNDTGHPTRKYIFGHYVPQAWVGDWCYEDHDPKYFLGRQAFLTKEIAEVLRRTSQGGAGIIHFANVCWYRNVYDSETLENYPVVEKMKLALSPVLVSAELYGRNYYAGDKIKGRVCIVNDDVSGHDLKQGIIKYSILSEERKIVSGEIRTKVIKHDSRNWNDFVISIPEDFSDNRNSCTLKFEFETDGKIVSHNEYNLIVARKKWLAADEIKNKKIALFDLTGETKNAFDFLGVKYSLLNQLKKTETDLLVIANIDKQKLTTEEIELLKTISQTTKVLFIHPGENVKSLLPIDSIVEEKGNVVNMRVPEASVFDELEPLDLSWWQSENREIPNVSRRVYNFTKTEVEKLGTWVRPHAYLAKPEQLKTMSGSALLKYKNMIVCELEINKAPIDPVAGKFLSNLLKFSFE